MSSSGNKSYSKIGAVADVAAIIAEFFVEYTYDATRFAEVCTQWRVGIAAADAAWETLDRSTWLPSRDVLKLLEIRAQAVPLSLALDPQVTHVQIKHLAKRTRISRLSIFSGRRLCIDSITLLVEQQPDLEEIELNAVEWAGDDFAGKFASKVRKSNRLLKRFSLENSSRKLTFIGINRLVGAFSLGTVSLTLPGGHAVTVAEAIQKQLSSVEKIGLEGAVAPPFASLRHFALGTDAERSNTVNDKVLQMLGEAVPLLESLEIPYAKTITAAGLATIGEKFEHLEMLNLNHCDVRDEGIEALLKNAQGRLRRFSLIGNTHITEEGVSMLKSCPQLREIAASVNLHSLVSSLDETLPILRTIERISPIQCSDDAALVALCNGLRLIGTPITALGIDCSKLQLFDTLRAVVTELHLDELRLNQIDQIQRPEGFLQFALDGKLCSLHTLGFDMATVVKKLVTGKADDAAFDTMNAVEAKYGRSSPIMTIDFSHRILLQS